jgi:putative transposase
MSRKRDKLTVGDAAWLDAVSREKVIRPLALLPRPSPLHVGAACRELKISRSRFYVLLNSLADLSGAWRIATLLSAAQMLDLVGARQLFGDVGRHAQLTP